MDANSRRGFLKGFGLCSAVLAGASASGLANAASSGVGVRPAAGPVLGPALDIGHLAPLGKVNLTLMADNNPPPEVGCYSGLSVYNTTSPTTMMSIGSVVNTPTDKNNVKMSVGKDNRLWIEVDGTWRRVALEG